MKSFVLVVAGVVLGALATVLLMPAAVGVGAGVGILTGLKAGACLTVEAAKERGFITSAQVSEVLRAAGEQIASSVESAEKPVLAGSDAECAKLVADLKKGPAN